jgi:Ca-activated chloride channel family protein
MASTTIRAQTNEIDVETDIDATYFHPAASRYIHGDTTSASNLVVQGLSIDPEDGKLLRLKELLEQQQEQQQNQDDQQNQDQQQQDQQEDQNQDQQDEPPKQNPEEQEQEQEQDQQDQQAKPPSAEEMSADEAEQLLDAMKQEEQNKRLQLHPVMGAPVKVDKDW